MAKVFEVWQRIADAEGSICCAPLGNILNIQANKHGGKVTIGVSREVIQGLIDNRYCGGLILVDKDEFRRVETECDAILEER